MPQTVDKHAWCTSCATASATHPGRTRPRSRSRSSLPTPPPARPRPWNGSSSWLTRPWAAPTRRSSGWGERLGRARPVPGLRPRDPHRHLHHQRDRVPELPLPPCPQRPRTLPHRTSRPEVPVPDRQEPGPHRMRPATLDQPLQSRPQHLRDHLRQPPIPGPSKPTADSYPVNLTGPDERAGGRVSRLSRSAVPTGFGSPGPPGGPARRRDRSVRRSLSGRRAAAG